MGAGARNQKSLRGGNKQPMGKEKMPPLFTSIGPNTEVSRCVFQSKMFSEL